MTQLPPTLVATFDGGGTRGLVCLYIFQAMMEIVKQIHQRQVAVERGWSGEILPDVTYDPHQWFDLMIGTSTGGLISISEGFVVFRRSWNTTDKTHFCHLSSFRSVGEIAP